MINKDNTEFNDQISENILRIKDLFPNVVTESESGIKIDFDKLKEELSKDLMDSKEERYQMTWPGKKASIKISNEPTDKTLIPDRESSVDFDNTKNIYIEGDNLEALKILKKSYEGKIKCIYIDPPYNTGNDFVYKDSFDRDKQSYLQDSNQLSEEGGRLVSNPETSGRYHSDWLSMMYPRLKLARDLLSQDGVIFISIDDNEVHNLRKICDEIFGEENFIFDLIRKTKSTTNDAKLGINMQHEYCLSYGKNLLDLNLAGGIKDLRNYKNPDNDINGDWVSSDPSAKSGGPSNYFEIKNPYTGKIDLPPTGMYWRFSKNTIQNHIDSGVINFKKVHKDSERGFIYKRYKNRLKTDQKTLDSLLFADNLFMNQKATKGLLDLQMAEYFTYPKGVEFISKLLEHATEKDSTVLDFFSGSSTTSHSTMQLNAEDGGSRKYIMVQIPEKTIEDSEAFKSGYKNICEIGKERIRRAAKKIKEETNADIDYGFKVFKVSDSIINSEIELSPNELLQNSLKFENIRDGLTNEDLLYSAILKTGLLLDSKVIKENISNNEFFTVVDSENNNVLVACFDKDIDFNENIIKFIASQNPLRVYFRDSSFKSDSDKINFEQKLNELTSESVEIYVL